MKEPSIQYLVINLPRAEKRRQDMLAQAERFGIELRFVPAVAGAELDLKSQSYGYDRKKRRKLYANDLITNEIACALSHRKALSVFLESGAEYAVIMEDDAVLDPRFNEGIDELIHHLHGWEAAKLFTDVGRLYPVLEPQEGRAVQPVFPRQLPWVAVGYLYTRRAAEVLHAKLERFWLPADAQIGRILLDEGVPTIGVSPGIIHSGDPQNENSTLDPNKERNIRPPKRSLLQYIAYRLSVIATGRGKKRMLRMMQQRLSRH